MNLTAKDITDLERIESEIEQDQTSFFRMCENLVTIRDRKLYQREYKTFASYCQLRWGWTPQWVNQQIRSAEVVRRLPEKTVETIVSKTGSEPNEQVARTLAKLPEEKRVEVVEHAAAKDEPLTAKSISESAKAVAAKAPEPEKERDATGWIIPEGCLPLFHESVYINSMLNKLADVRGWARRMQDSPGAYVLKEWSPNEALVMLDNLYGEMKRAVPYAVCPMCQGILKASCRCCRGMGAISQFQWDTVITADMKRMRQLTIEDQRKAA